MFVVTDVAIFTLMLSIKKVRLQISIRSGWASLPFNSLAATQPFAASTILNASQALRYDTKMFPANCRNVVEHVRQ